MPEEIIRQYLFDRPGHYQIRVVGKLAECWKDNLEGLEVSHGPWGNYPLVTPFSGGIAAQTALSGLRGLLIARGLVILSVERLVLCVWVLLCMG